MVWADLDGSAIPPNKAPIAAPHNALEKASVSQNCPPAFISPLIELSTTEPANPLIAPAIAPPPTRKAALPPVINTIPDQIPVIAPETAPPATLAQKPRVSPFGFSRPYKAPLTTAPESAAEHKKCMFLDT